MRKIFFVAIILVICNSLFAQTPDKIYMANIHTPMLYQQGNFYGYPIISIGSLGGVELHFDDFDTHIKNYYYTYQLCNADWQPVDLSPFDYIKGFTQNAISQYHVSSIAKTKYVHYQALLPEGNCLPYKSGNYILKVFLNGDTSKLAFTKRLLIVNNIIPVAAKILQPYNSELINTHQKVQFSIDITKLNALNPLQQVKVVVLQNYRWDNAVYGAQPQFMRQNLFEYNGEKDFVFPAGKEYRWLDMRSFSFQTDRMKNVDENATPIDVEVVPDLARSDQQYLYYSDRNGFYEISSIESINPLWQGDYANVHFTFIPRNNIAFPDKDVYIIGQMNNYNIDDSAKLIFNPDKGLYEKTLLLKQGYYTYLYATKSTTNDNEIIQLNDTEGNYWETENTYTVLIYYRSFADRADELVGATTINSRTTRTGF